MKKLGWNELLEGAVVFPFSKKPTDLLEIHSEDREYSENSSFNLSVAHWRTDKPIYNTEHCVHCYQCWVYCPDSSILVRTEKMSGIDYEHCKGCGVCANVCPTNPKSLIMFQDQIDEEDALEAWPVKHKKLKAEESH